MAPESEAMLETERLVLRRRQATDAAVLHELWTERDPRVPPHRRISPDGHPTREEIEESIRRDDVEEGMGLLSVVSKTDGRVIGYCGLIANTHGQDGEPELAYELLRAVWGHGFTSEAASAVVGWAEASAHPRLWATIREWNIASRRVAVKLGFVETGRVIRDAVHGDSLFYARDLPGTVGRHTTD